MTLRNEYDAARNGVVFDQAVSLCGIGQRHGAVHHWLHLAGCDHAQDHFKLAARRAYCADDAQAPAIDCCDIDLDRLTGDFTDEDNPAARYHRTPNFVKHSAAHRVDRHVGTPTTGRFAHAASEPAVGSNDNAIGTRLPEQDFLRRSTGRCNDKSARRMRDLDRVDAKSAGTRDQHALSLANLACIADCVVRGAHRARDDRAGGKIDIRRQQCQIVASDGDVFGITPTRVLTEEARVRTQRFSIRAAHGATAADIFALRRANSIADGETGRTFADRHNFARYSRTRVNGPGQNRVASRWAISGQTFTTDLAIASPETCTISGLDEGRSLAA